MEQNPSKLCLAYEQFFNFSNHNKFPGFAPVVGFPWVHQLKCILFDTHYAEVEDYQTALDFCSYIYLLIIFFH